MKECCEPDGLSIWHIRTFSGGPLLNVGQYMNERWAIRPEQSFQQLKLTEILLAKMSRAVF